MSRHVVCLAVVALTVSCNSASLPPTPSDLGSRVTAQQPERPASLQRFSYSGINEAKRMVISDPATWATVWAQLTQHVSPAPELPAVDFGANRLILVAMGTRPSGGYEIRVDSLVEFENGSLVFVTSESPGSDCVTTQALTAPVDIVLVGRSEEPIVFRDGTAVHHCS